MKISNDKTSTFKAGLTPELFRDLNKINIKDVEADFAKIGVDANFADNKFICGSSVLTANILGEISAKYKLPFDYLPFAIRAYNDKNLIYDDVKKCEGFSNADTKRILKNDPPYIGTSIFFNDTILHSPILTDIRTTIRGLSKYCSSAHFLHPIIHEWFHCIHDNIVYKSQGYEGNCPVLKAKYFKPEANGLDMLQDGDIMYDVALDNKLQNLIKRLVSKYAAYNYKYSEFFAELMTMITIKSLDFKLNPIKNPLDNIPQKLPKNLKFYIEAALNI